MQKTGYLIFLIVFLALVVTTGMAKSIRKLGDTYCFTTNVADTACHGDRCHSTTSYIYTCDTYIGDDCDNFTNLFVLCNSTGSCRNTTRDVRACYGNFNDYCINGNFVTHCCTNGVCHNRTTQATCNNLDTTKQSYNRIAASVCADPGRDCNPFFPFDPTACVDRITAGFRRRLGISK